MGKMQIIPAAYRAGLSRVEAAEYVGVSATLFDEMVKDGRMPQPRRANSRLIWLRLELDVALANLPFASGCKGTAQAATQCEPLDVEDEKFWNRVA